MKLHPHPEHRSAIAVALAAEIDRDGETLLFRYSLSAPEGAVRMPAHAEPARIDGLWQTTCFEAFIRGEGDRYAELNFSPSGQWAAYLFDSHREGMRELALDGAPEIAIERALGQLGLTATVPLPAEFARDGAPLALTAVIEERDGTKSYWALAHPDGPPDFHQPDCFVARLP